MKDLLKFLSKYSFFLFFIFLEGVSLILIVQSNSFQRSAFINSTRSVTGFFHQNLQSYIAYFHLRKSNISLHEENIMLRNALANHTGTDTTENTSLDQGEDTVYQFISARVLNNSVSKQYNYITLNAGRNKGLAEDMAVISQNGIVGIVIGVSEHFSVVLPVLNRNFKVSAKIKRNNYFGVAEWDGINKQFIKLKEIPLHVDVFPGDTLVTSGHSAIFPEGLPIGIISEIKGGDSNFFEIKLRLITEFGNLYYVTVINNRYQEEQLLLENQGVL